MTQVNINISVNNGCEKLLKKALRLRFSLFFLFSSILYIIILSYSTVIVFAVHTTTAK